ncbi:MAG TPA: M1 family metallopeptidase [Candidatus Saccharibacteria bacterium]|nr:M1 family metallopeptidase [Candidatus Saccharibacteria bacterium]
MGKNVKRLYTSFIPERYNLSIALSEDKKTFEGSVLIRGKKTGRPSKRFTFHQKNLTIKNCNVARISKNEQHTEMPISRTLTLQSADELRIHSPEVLPNDTYEIFISFSGNITNNMDGIYPCIFSENGQNKRLIATQFESHHAREAFPCIDEPEAKAIFTLTLDHDPLETALSNTPVMETVRNENGRQLSIFEPTPIMSTYLLAFVVGELRYLEKASKSGVKIRTYATSDQIEHASFALDVAVRAMDFYENYYDIPFPLKKCDFVALPDFASGAMENWGLITFREQTLLVDEHTSLSTKQYVAIVVAHELTHQWFGNLVTMHWWTDLWLNEGFASWMEYLAIDSLFPEWNVWTQFAVDEQQAALKADALEHTHPVEVQVHHPDEIHTIFDIISYQKGASVIHMLYEYLGEIAFRDGLRYYLKKFAYKNATTADLWQSLESVTNKPVVSFMSAWTKHTGFPLITVTAKKDHISISQQRFVSNPKSKAREDQSRWPVPLLSDRLSKKTLSRAKENFPIKSVADALSINVNARGFYRISYDESVIPYLEDALQNNTLHEIQRMTILADVFESTRAGYQNVETYLQILSRYRNESSLPVWEIIASSLGSIKHILSGDDGDDTLRNAMKPYIANLTQSEFVRLGWEPKENESHLDTLLRPLIVSLRASSDDEQILNDIRTYYERRVNQGENINPDIRAIVYATSARTGGLKEFNELLALYKSTKSSDEKLALTAGMTSFESPAIHEKVLELIQSDAVRLQDILYWIAYSFMNRHVRVQTWEWLQENWSWLKNSIGTDLSFSRLPVYTARAFTNDRLKDEYEKFFNNHMEPMLKRSFDQGLETIETNTAWRERDSQLALKWFKDQQK